MSFWTTSPTRTFLTAATASFTSVQVPSRNTPSSQGAGLLNVLCPDLLILGESGEVEEADVQPLLVEAIHSHGQVEGIGSDDPVLRPPAVPASPPERTRRIPCPSDDEDVGLEVHGEFQRPGEDDRAVLRLDRDPGTSRDRRQTGDDPSKNDQDDNRSRRRSMRATPRLLDDSMTLRRWPRRPQPKGRTSCPRQITRRFAIQSGTVPNDLGAARATDAPITVIDDFSDGLDGWVTRSPATDPIPPIPSLLRALNGPGGVPGITVTQAIPILTHKVGDP